MINMLVYFFFMVISFVSLFFVSCWLYFFKISMIMEWSFISVSTCSMNMFILLDWVSVLFVSMVLLISSMVFFYSSEYMYGDKSVSRFIVLVFMFILSMIFMIVSPSIFSILFGWDGLGLVSYCLVIYYQNYMSYNSGMVTVLFNRVGDVSLLVAIGLMFMYGSWGLYIVEDQMIMLLLLLASFTKSAQIPFSVWLPMAMAAPTPVSALVHSSTLVTAGVYLIIRYNKMLMHSDFSWMVLFISIFTMFISGMMACLEFDLKKIIALSTLSQLGVMFLSLSVGGEMVAFFHLLIHAIFKSMLFMSAGSVIHLMSGSQDIRSFGGLVKFCPFIMISFYVSVFSLCGFPFMSGFYSKDLIMEMVFLMPMSSVLVGMMICSLVFTVMYSFRLMKYSFFGELKLSVFNKVSDNLVMGSSVMILMIFSVVSGSVMNWMFFFDLYIPFISYEVKMICLMSCLMGVWFSASFSYVFEDIKLFGVVFFSSFWFMEYLMKSMSEIVLISGKWGLMVDKIWLEYSGSLIFKKVRLNVLKFKVGELKIYSFMSLVVIYLLFMNFMFL